MEGVFVWLRCQLGGSHTTEGWTGNTVKDMSTPVIVCWAERPCYDLDRHAPHHRGATGVIKGPPG